MKNISIHKIGAQKKTYLHNPFVGWVFFQSNQSIENDQLDVVVAFLDDQINVAGGGSLDGGRSTGQCDQGARGFVAGGGARRIQQVVDAADEA